MRRLNLRMNYSWCYLIKIYVILYVDEYFDYRIDTLILEFNLAII